MLSLSYSKNSAVLKNLFTFNDAVLDLNLIKELLVP